MPLTDPAPAAAPTPAEHIAALLALANRHEQEGRLDEAEAVLDDILAQAPVEPGAVHQKGIVLFRRARMAEAAALMERSIALLPGSALFHRNLCEVYRALGRRDEALAIGRRAVELDPADPHGHHNLGVLHYDRLELDEAIAAAERALALDPELPGAHFSIAEASLLRGDFARGWEEYEWRFRLAGAAPLMPPGERRQWDGRPLGQGNTLLLVADQGYGDVIQFARYIPWAAARCTDIAIACSSELHPVVAQLAPAGALFDHWDRVPEFAAYCALSGLPRLAGTRAADDPRRYPLHPRRGGAFCRLGRAAVGDVAARLPPHRDRLGRAPDPPQ